MQGLYHDQVCQIIEEDVEPEPDQAPGSLQQAAHVQHHQQALPWAAPEYEPEPIPRVAAPLQQMPAGRLDHHSQPPPHPGRAMLRAAEPDLGAAEISAWPLASRRQPPSSEAARVADAVHLALEGHTLPMPFAVFAGEVQLKPCLLLSVAITSCCGTSGSKLCCDTVGQFHGLF